MLIKIGFNKNDKNVERVLTLKLVDENISSLQELKNIKPEELEEIVIRFITDSLQKTLTKDFVREMFKELIEV